MKTLKEMQLVGAFVTSAWGRSTLSICDDTLGEFFLIGDEFGPTHVIRADGVQSALSIWTDEQQSIPLDEVCEAYGLDSEEELRALDERGEYPELAEGYEYQDNAGGGSGIVNAGYYQWIVPLDAANRERLGVTIQVADYV